LILQEGCEAVLRRAVAAIYAMMPILKTLIFTVLVPGTVAVYVPYRIARPSGICGASWLSLSGTIMFVVGALIYLSCAWHFAWTGRGTPAPIDPPKVLIVHGLNRYVRNPMYIGVLMMILGQAAFFGSVEVLYYAAFFLVAVNLFVLFYEEPHLRKQFGASYEEYLRTVPRWLPKLR
jgi:protein-S-isoprenylcysteine O-methyltransferase Ste14